MKKPLPDKIISLWVWPVDLVMDVLKNRWLRIILIAPAFLTMIVLMFIFGIPFVLCLLAEPFYMAWTGKDYLD